MQNVRSMCMAVLLLVAGYVGAENLLFSDCGVRTSRRQPRSYGTVPPQSGSENSTIPSQPFMRSPKIMHGTPTVEGQYPWQVSLELLHPSYGFIGHWCGGVLIDRNWVLSAAHCIHNDLFNLPLPALWTVVLGEYDRRMESGLEQRIPVDKIILHEKYHNFKHDLVLLKLMRPANTSPISKVRKICLPFADFKVNSMVHDPRPDQQSKLSPNTKPAYFFDEESESAMDIQYSPPKPDLPEDSQTFPEPVLFRDDNFLRSLKREFEAGNSENRVYRTRTARYMVNHLVVGQIRAKINRTKIPAPNVDQSSDVTTRRFFIAGMLGTASHSKQVNNDGRRWNLRSPLESARRLDSGHITYHHQNHRANQNSKFGNRRRNDKFSHAPVFYRNEPNYRTEDTKDYSAMDIDDPPAGIEMNSDSSVGTIPDTSHYVDCVATGWGKSTIDDELTDVLLQTRAPIQSSKQCEEAYGDFIKLHRGHLCAGNLDGTGGTCVGDSGGPLQCRISKRGPWILVGITSFGSGCAFKNYPDVYTKISYYRQWIVETIRNN